MNKLIIALSGRKQSGKSSVSKFIMKEYINAKLGQKRFDITKTGKEIFFIDTFNNNSVIPVDHPNPQSKQLAQTYGVKIYSFADPLKKLCIDVLGLDAVQCYGSDDDKNSATHLLWDDFPMEVREKYSRKRRGTGELKPATGKMTAREVMQVVGTEIFRQIDSNCWARGTYSVIESEGYEVAIIADARFPNEVTLGTEIGAKVIRLERDILPDGHESEHALDEFPKGEYSLVCYNQDKTMAETHKFIKPHLFEWFKQKSVV